jgi:hypothetical protein
MQGWEIEWLCGFYSTLVEYFYLYARNTSSTSAYQLPKMVSFYVEVRMRATGLRLAGSCPLDHCARSTQ